MNMEIFVGLVLVILMGLIIFIFVLSPQPKYQDSISYQLAPNTRNLTKNDFEIIPTENNRKLIKLIFNMNIYIYIFEKIIN